MNGYRRRKKKREVEDKKTDVWGELSNNEYRRSSTIIPQKSLLKTLGNSMIMALDGLPMAKKKTVEILLPKARISVVQQGLDRL